MKKTWRPFTPEDNEIIRSDYADYVDVRVIAEKLGRDFGTIRARLYAMGLKRDRAILRMLKWCPEHLKPILKEKGSAAFIEAVNAHSEQLEQSGAELSNEQSAEMAAQIAAIDARPELERREKMSAMRALGLTLREIGEHFGVSGERARQLTDRDYRRPHPRTGSVENLLAVNARLAAKLEENKRRVRAKISASLIDMWDSADDGVREEFLRRIYNNDNRNLLNSIFR
jgi:hypothetical protein